MGADYVANGSLLLRPADLLASLTDLTQLAPCQQRLLLRSFRSGRSLFLPSDITTTASGKVLSAGSSPAGLIASFAPLTRLPPLAGSQPARRLDRSFHGV